MAVLELLFILKPIHVLWLYFLSLKNFSFLCIWHSFSYIIFTSFPRNPSFSYLSLTLSFQCFNRSLKYIIFFPKWFHTLSNFRSAPLICWPHSCNLPVSCSSMDWWLGLVEGSCSGMSFYHFSVLHFLFPCFYTLLFISLLSSFCRNTYFYVF